MSHNAPAANCLVIAWHPNLENSNTGAAVDNDADGSVAAAERVVVEKAEDGCDFCEDRSGGRTSRTPQWLRTNEDDWRFLW